MNEGLEIRTKINDSYRVLLFAFGRFYKNRDYQKIEGECIGL
jgi:hypothetical protein